MDETVLRAMARWPNVPAVYGWLALDRRGRWLIKGETIINRALRQFISRNYMVDQYGHYAFQNGPQRVYVALEYTPWVARLDARGAWVLHTDVPVMALSGAWVDELGNLLVQTDQGVALWDDRDLEPLADTWCTGDGGALDDDGRAWCLSQLVAGQTADLAIPWSDSLIPIAPIHSTQVAARFGFTPIPEPALLA